MGPEPVNNPVNTLVANAGPNTVHSSAIKDVNDGANAIHKTTKAAVDDLGFNKPSLIKWGKWLIGKLGPFGYVVTIVLSPILIPASLTYDAGRGMKLLFRKISRVEEPVQKLLPMVAKQVEDARKLEQHKQDLESRSAEISNQLAALKVHSGELKGSNDQFAQRAQQLDQKLNREQNRNHELNILLEQLVRRADDLELENADSRKRYQALKVALDKQLAEKSLRIQRFSKELEAARQQHDQEDDIWARQAQADEIRSLECKLAADRQQMCDLEARYQAKVRTLEGQHQFEVMELEAQHRLEVEALETHHQDHMQALNVQNEAKVQELLREISDLHELAKTKEHNLEDRLKPVVELLETKIAEVEQQLEARNTRIAQLNQQCSESTEECLHLKLQLDELNEKRLEELNLNKLAQMMYENDVQKLQEKLDEMSSSAEMVSRHVQTAAVTVIEPRERVDTASQADIEPPVLIDTAAQADIEPPVLIDTAAQADIEPPVLVNTASQADIEPLVLVNTASQADIDSRERDHQQVVSGRDEVPVESESRMYAQEERVEALKVEVARLEAEREVLLKQAEESQCVTRPDHGNLQQEAVSVNVDTQKELENTNIKLHAAEDRALALSEALRQLRGKLKGTEAHVHRLAAEKVKLVNQIEKQEGDLNSLEIVITGKPSVSPDSTALKEAVKQRLKTDGHIIEQLGSKSEWDDKEKDLLLERNVELENENYRLSQEVHRHLEQQNDQLKADWLQLYKKETESARVEEKP